MWKEFKKWRSENKWSIVIAILFFIAATVVTLVFICFSIFEENWKYVLLFSAVFGGGLAIWGRVNTQRQIELTRRSQNNEVFAKAIEMIGEGKVMSQIGGLQIIFKLMQDEPEVEYIRCINFVASWLQEDFASEKSKNYPEKELQKRIPYIIRRQISEILKFDFKGKDEAIKKYKQQSENDHWPSLGKINFQNVSLENANLEGAWLFKSKFRKAKLSGVNLTGANLTGADMSEAKGLTAEQILSAKWYDDSRKAGPPELPTELKKDKEIKEWLKKSHGEMS